MLTFEYTARDPATGQRTTSTVEAENEKAAIKILQSQGLAPLELKAKNGENHGIVAKFTNRIGAKDKVLFSRQLSTLINAGLPLVQSLHNVASQTQNKNLQLVITKVTTDVEAGTAFSVALGKFPTVFDAVFVNLVAAGEVSGTLDTSLERIANQKEKDAAILSKVRGAMVYPIIVLIVMVGVIIFMVVKVVPAVQVIYEGIPGVKLPFITQIFVTAAHLITKYWWALLVIIAIIVVGCSRWARTLGGKSFIDKVKMRAWPLGPLFMKLYMARFARIGATLVASGVPLIQMLEITGKAINNVHVEASLKRATEKVKGGKSLSESIRNDPSFLTLVPDMLRIGEESGSIEQMLGKTADYYEREVDDEVNTISTTIEPALMILMGAVAIIVVVAVLLPVYGLVGKIQVQ